MKKLITLFIILFLLFTVENSFTQVNTYTFSQFGGTYSEITGDTTVAFATGTTNPQNMDDVVYLNNTLPFTFKFNSVNYTNLVISSNGFITFGNVPPASSTSNPISSTIGYNGASAPFGRDLIGTRGVTAVRTIGSNILTGVIAAQFTGVEVGRIITGAGIPAATTISALNSGTGTITMSAVATSTGTATTYLIASGSIVRGTSNGVHTIQFRNVRTFTTSANSNNYNFQIKLYQTTNKIEFVYGTSTASTSSTGQVGLRGLLNTDFNNRTTTTDWTATTLGGTNSSACTISSTVIPPAGRTFTWTPPVPLINNVGVLEILNPLAGYNSLTGSPITPQATIKNFGSGNQLTPFNITCKINPGGYTSTVSDTISSDLSHIKTFANFSPSAGITYTVTVYTQLGTDQNRANDTLKQLSSYIYQNYGNDSGYYYTNNLATDQISFPNYCWQDTSGSKNLLLNGVVTGGINLVGTVDDGYFPLSLKNILITLNQDTTNKHLKYAGICYDSIFPASNGIIGFTQQYGVTSLISWNVDGALAPKNALLPLWHDFDLGTLTFQSQNRVSYKVNNNQLIITYDKIASFIPENDWVSFQVVIEIVTGCGSSNSNFRFSYADTTTGQTSGTFVTDYLSQFLALTGSTTTFRNYFVGFSQNGAPIPYAAFVSSLNPFPANPSTQVNMKRPLFNLTSHRGLAVEFGPNPNNLNGFCPSNTCANFQTGLSPWTNGYGSSDYNTGQGCEDPGYVRLYGNRKTGSAIKQNNISIIAGRVYELRYCVRLDSISPSDYAKVRAVAFNNFLPSDGTHPQPTTDIAIMDISGKITCSEWSYNTSYRWKANNNFNSIAINCENNFGSSWIPFGTQLSIVDIDNVCLVEVSDSIPCYLANLDSLGNPLPPIGGEIDTLCPSVEDTVEIYQGRVSDLYAQCSGATNGVDTWYENCPDSCASIGGVIPDSLKNFLMGDSLSTYLDEIGYDSVGDFEEDMLAVEDSIKFRMGNLQDTLFNLGSLPLLCDSLVGISPPVFTNDPFQGRDIIFVHGFRTDPLCDRVRDGPLPRWPQNKGDFTLQTGYWKKGANYYWQEHIEKYLGVEPDGSGPSTIYIGNHVLSNRFLVVSHAVTQPGIVGVFAILEQISNAMKNNEGVIECNPGSRPNEKFGQNGFVIISHSAGALLSDVAMSIAAKTRTKPYLNLALGNRSDISDRCILHVSLNGAYGGSNQAASLIASTYIPGIRNLVWEGIGCTPLDFTQMGWIFNSELVDMSIPHTLYGSTVAGIFFNLNLMNDVPMDVITVSGGHPSEYGIRDTSFNRDLVREGFKEFLIKHLLHRGFDDGVISIEGQSDVRESRKNYPMRYLPRPGLLYAISPLLNEKLFDMGINNKRAFRYYLDQKLDLPSDAKSFASSGCIPWLSPSGMVQPVLIAHIPFRDPMNKFNNHYSFLQAASDHMSGSTDLHNWNYRNYYNIWEGVGTNNGPNNSEEERVISDPSLYTSRNLPLTTIPNIISPSMKEKQIEIIRGKNVTFTIRFLGKKWKFTYWFWKRKYHLLDDSNEKNQVDYVYEYVLKP